MTEACRISALDLENAERKAGSVGKEMFHLSLKILDENDREVAPGEVGGDRDPRPECVAGGYWNRPEENQTAFREGWFYTSDLGRRDEEGFLYLVGRKMETIIISGRNVYPAEVERALKEVPGVMEAVAVGLPDPAKGQVVGAVVSGERPDAGRGCCTRSPAGWPPTRCPGCCG